MTALTTDFLQNRQKSAKFRKLILPLVIIFVVVAASVAAGFYFYQKSPPKPQVQSENPQVAGAATPHLPKDWLLKYFGADNENDSKVGGVYGDPDKDGLNNYEEYLFETDPTKYSTAGDGRSDAITAAFRLGSTGGTNSSLGPTAQATVDQYIQENDLQDLSKESIQKEMEKFLQPDRAITMDFPDDKELTITKENDIKSFEKYYNDTQALATSDGGSSKLSDDITSLTNQELAAEANRLRTVVSLMKKIPVPAPLLQIQKFKIAEWNAAIKIVELLRDNYDPSNPDNQQLWADVFQQASTAQTAEYLELAIWQQLGLKLKDEGGLAE